MLNYKIKVSNFNKLIQSTTVLEFYSQNLDVKNLKKIFDGEWFVEDNMTWVKVLYNQKYTFEFINEIVKYSYINDSESYVEFSIPTPTTIDEFISDMNRIGIELFWKKSIITKYQPQFLIDKDKIEMFQRVNLNNINKSFELL